MDTNETDVFVHATGDSSTVQEMIPPILYKYRNWNTPFHNSTLTDQQLYFSSAYQFEDENDCRFPVEFDFNQETLEAYFMHDIRVNLKSSWTDDQIKAMARYQFKENFGSPAKLKAKEAEFYQRFNRNQGILCLCKNNDVPGMWQDYAADFKGYCVGMTLNNHAQDMMDNMIFGGTVNYVPHDYPPFKYVWAYKTKKEDLIWFMMQMIMTKYTKYTFEDEYRLGKFFVSAVDVPVADPKRYYTVPKEAYSQIIFGYLMDPTAIHEIMDVCQTQGLNVDYLLARPDEDGNVIVEPYN